MAVVLKYMLQYATIRRRVIGIPGSLIWSKTLMELIFNPCGEFRWSPESPVCQTHSSHLHVGSPGIFSDLLRSVQILKRGCGAESNGKLPYLFISSKTTTLVPEFAVEDLPLDRTTTLVPAFAAKDLTLGSTLWWWWHSSLQCVVTGPIFLCSLPVTLLVPLLISCKINDRTKNTEHNICAVYYL